MEIPPGRELPPIKILVVFDPNQGTVKVEGDIGLTTLAVGILECAKSVLMTSQRKSPLAL